MGDGVGDVKLVPSLCYFGVYSPMPTSGFNANELIDVGFIPLILYLFIQYMYLQLYINA